MTKVKKITVHVPELLLKHAQKSSQGGITETVKKGLELLAAGQAYQELLALKGKVRFSLNLDTLRSDDK